MRTTMILLLFSFASPAFAIKKCQDADGRWHYGDIAVAECKHSKITTLDNRGFVTDQQAAPKTAEEIVAEKEEMALLETEKKQKLADAEEKRRVLSIYETEEDIDRQRDNQLNSLQRNMDVHAAYLKGMDSRIARYQANLQRANTKVAKDKYHIQIKEARIRVQDSTDQLAQLIIQKDQIMKKFAKEKEIYRALKSSN